MILRKVKTIVLIAGFLVTAFVLNGCKSLEGTKIAQIYHDITAKYNGYFNARELMKDVVHSTRKSYKDDFNEVLPLHRFPTESLAKQNTSNCDKVIKKSTRVIQKHEPSKWTDDCYFLMGKAYFYKGEYISAIERFRYVKSKFSGGKRAYESLIWIAFAYLQQGDVDQAQAMLTNIKTEGEFPNSLKKDLALAEATVALERNKYSTASKKIKNVLPKVNEKALKTRYLFILGQIAQERGKYSKAIINYNKVLSNRPVYEMAFHAKINKASCFQKHGTRDIKKVQKNLKKMLKDDKNVDYKSRIFFELAQLAKKNNNQEQFVRYLNKALEAEQATPKQKANAYRNLANYHFKKGNYGKAQTYFDNTFQLISPEHEAYQQVKSKKSVLDDLIRHKQTMQRQDSLQEMANWGKNRFRSQFKKVLKKQKQKKKAKKQQQKKKKQLERLRRNQQKQLAEGQNFGRSSNRGGNWYFYNSKAKSRGLPAFERQWGKRPLQDNWRIKTEKSSDFKEAEKEEKSPTKKDTAQNKRKSDINNFAKQNEVIPENFEKLPKAQKLFYVQIPFDSSQKINSRKKVQKALFNIGSIYYQSLQDFEKAIRYFKKLNQNFPNSQYKPRSLFYLYKIYHEKNQAEKAKIYSQKLKNQYPESKYTTLIENPEKLRQKARENNSELEQFYQKTFQYYKDGKCEKVRVRQKKADSNFEANYLSHKFEYIRILCEGKNEDTKSTFKQKLKDYMEKYPQEKATVSHAQNVYNYLVKHEGKQTVSNKQEKDFPFNEDSDKTHLYFMVLSLEKHNTQKIKQAFAEYNNEYYKFLNLDISSLMYGRKKRLILIRDFKDKNQALSYLKSIANDKDFKEKLGLESPNHYVANIANYKQVISEKALPLYEQFFNQEYLKTKR